MKNGGFGQPPVQLSGLPPRLLKRHSAGSLVAYSLFITDVDPLKHSLLFERFLNPERISMPDIDIDFPDTRRDEVIQYVQNKYGANIRHADPLGIKKPLKQQRMFKRIHVGNEKGVSDKRACRGPPSRTCHNALFMRILHKVPYSRADQHAGY